MDNEFVTPPNHFGFKAKKLFGEIEGTITDCAVAYIEPEGGGPKPGHTHMHDHLFIVLEGRARIRMGDEWVKLGENCHLRVPGQTEHSVWNDSEEPLKMLGLSIGPVK